MLGDAKSSLGDAKSSLGDVQVPFGESMVLRFPDFGVNTCAARCVMRDVEQLGVPWPGVEADVVLEPT